MDTAKYAHIVGVFRGRAKADQAVEAIKQAGMSDVELTVYDPQAAGVVDTPVDAGEASAMDTSVDTSAVETATRLATATRFLVHVLAEGRSRMPSVSWPIVERTTLISLPARCLSTVPSSARMKTAPSRVAETSTDPTPAERFFGTAKAPGHPHESSVMDHPDAPQR